MFSSIPMLGGRAVARKKFSRNSREQDMDEEVFWVWNGWGLLLTAVLAVWQFLHIFVTLRFGSGTPLRSALSAVALVAFVLTFFLSGWISGLLALPLGIVGGFLLAKLFLPKPV